MIDKVFCSANNTSRKKILIHSMFVGEESYCLLHMRTRLQLTVHYFPKWYFDGRVNWLMQEFLFVKCNQYLQKRPYYCPTVTPCGFNMKSKNFLLIDDPTFIWDDFFCKKDTKNLPPFFLYNENIVSWLIDIPDFKSIKISITVEFVSCGNSKASNTPVL